VSTAYYALFHFVIAEATSNWGQSELRPLLGKVFEHGKMKQACEKIALGNLRVQPFVQRVNPKDHLRAVAIRFIQAQEMREDADYDVDRQWSQKDVDTQLEQVQDALKSWIAIRETLDAQRFLVLLLGPKHRRRPA
jgi:hypothetical protein